MPDQSPAAKEPCAELCGTFPHPLRYLGSEVWSRRLTQEHRCVYVVEKDQVDFLQGRYHC